MNNIGETIYLALFWAILVSVAFNLPYFLFSVDRRSRYQLQFGQAGRNLVPSPARTALTSMIGTLIVVGTYASILSEKVFELKDCTVLALVAAHGWMAEDMVNQFLEAVQQNPSPGLNSTDLQIDETIEGEVSQHK